MNSYRYKYISKKGPYRIQVNIRYAFLKGSSVNECIHKDHNLGEPILLPYLVVDKRDLCGTIDSGRYGICATQWLNAECSTVL